MSENKGLLKIGQLAKLAGVLPSTIHFYTQQGLLKPGGWSRGGYRLYDKDLTLRQIAKIDYLQNKKRLTIAEIKRIIK
jgi:DNA-binding transcriptional MerR regulator